MSGGKGVVNMLYTISFSHVVEGQRVPLIIDDREYTMQVEASSKSGALSHPDVKTFCESRDDDCRPRRVN